MAKENDQVKEMTAAERRAAEIKEIRSTVCGTSNEKPDKAQEVLSHI